MIKRAQKLMKLNLSILTCFSTLLLSACDPSFETTSELCSNGESDSVDVAFSDLNIKGSDDEYQPYLQDILNALQITETLEDADEQTALDEALTNIYSLINKFMPYEVITNVSGDFEIQTTSALDIMEAVIATTNSDTVYKVDEDGVIVLDENNEPRNLSLLVEAFKLAKKQLAAGIKADDGFCIYKSNSIKIRNFATQTNTNTETEINTLQANLTLTYDPFNGTFSQNIFMTETNTDSNDTDNGLVTNYVGFYDAPPNDFEAVGYTPPTVRFGSANNTEQTETLTIDDDFIEKLGQIEYAAIDNYCTLKDSEGEDYIFTGDTALIVESKNTLTNTFVFTGKILNIQRNTNNEHTLAIDDNFISVKFEGDDEKSSVILDTIVVNSSEPIATPADTDESNPVTIQNNILTIDLSKTNGLVTLQGDALYIDGEKQLDDEGGTLFIRANTAVIKERTLIIDDAFAYGTTNQQKIAINCKTDVVTRSVQKAACEGGSFDSSSSENKLPNEVGKRKAQKFDLNTNLTSLKRFRIETDYAFNTSKIYVSEYNEALFDIEGDKLILDPTPCEEQALLDDLFNALSEEEREADDFEGVRLTLIPDSGYDFVFELNADGSVKQDDSGAGVINQDLLPEPIFTFTGTAIPARQ
jgi:hypothetical protein